MVETRTIGRVFTRAYIGACTDGKSDMNQEMMLVCLRSICLSDPRPVESVWERAWAPEELRRGAFAA
jgi:hypothetical protein